MGRIQGPHNIHGRENRKGRVGRIRPITGGEGRATKLPGVVESSDLLVDPGHHMFLLMTHDKVVGTTQ